MVEKFIQGPQLRQIAYLPHDGLVGIPMPDLYWNPQTGAFEFGTLMTPVDVTVHGNFTIDGAFVRARGQMDNCGTQNLKSVSEANPLAMPFASGSYDAPLINLVSPGVFQVGRDGIYLLSYSLPFESDTIVILQGTSVGACWQASMDGQNWVDLIQTKSYDTVHGVADDHGSLSLPPVELSLVAGTYLRVAAFQMGTAIDVYVNSNDNHGGPFNWSWARVEAFRVSVAPPPPPNV
jgi:hypothetical protein